MLNGEYGMRETYNQLQRKKDTMFWHRTIWHQWRIHKHAFLAWLVISGGLKKLEKLHEWDLVMMKICMICNRERE